MRDYREALPKPEKRKKRGRPARSEAPVVKQAETEQSARDEVKKGRFLLVARRENLDEAQTDRLAVLLRHHPALSTVRRFMDDFYGIFDGNPRPSMANERWELLIKRSEYVGSPYLAGALKILGDEERFDKVALHLSYANLNSTSNDVERDNRGFRKRQKTHYRFRDRESIEALLKRRLVEAGPPTSAHRLRRRFGNPNWGKRQAG